MTPTIVDPSLYCHFEEEKLVGINGNYFDDPLGAGAHDWKTHSDVTLEQFEITGK